MKKCRCEICRMAEQDVPREKALLLVNEREMQLMRRHGWVAHYIVDIPSMHTHGLPESFGHPDLEIRLPASPEAVHRLCAAIVDRIKAGRRFHEGEEATDVFNVPVRFIGSEESGRRVLRVLFPDPQGRFPGEPGCEPGYNSQLGGVIPMTAIKELAVGLTDHEEVSKMRRAILDALAQDREKAIADLCRRTDEDGHVLPWLTAFSFAFRQLDQDQQEWVVEFLKKTGNSKDISLKRGAVRLLIKVSDANPSLRSRLWPELKKIRSRERDELIRYWIDGYLSYHSSAERS